MSINNHYPSDAVITLQQDGGEKIKITRSANDLMDSASLYFGWKKPTIKRIMALGSSDFNRFIKHVSKTLAK